MEAPKSVGIDVALEQEFIRSVQWAMHVAHQISTNHGFHTPELSTVECLALVHSEVSEIVEAVRVHNPPDVKVPGFSEAETEAADVVIRILDLCRRNRWDLAGAIMVKMRYNNGREYRHGGKAL